MGSGQQEEFKTNKIKSGLPANSIIMLVFRCSVSINT